MNGSLLEHQRRLVQPSGAPNTIPALTPGVQFDPEPPPEGPPWWMLMGEEGLAAARRANDELDSWLTTRKEPSAMDVDAPLAIAVAGRPNKRGFWGSFRWR